MEPGAPVGNWQFTDEQRTEAFRTLHAQHLERQTKAAETTRQYVGWLLAITLILILLQVFAAAAASSQ